MKNAKLLFLCVLMVPGCTHTVEVSGERGSSSVRAQKFESTGTEIEVISDQRGFTARQLVRVMLIKEESVNGLLKLHLGFQSRSDKFLTIQYKLKFFDERGFPLERFDVGWLPLSVDPRSVTYQEVMARTKDARTYKVHVRRLD